MFSRRLKELIDRFDASNQTGSNIMTNVKLHTIVQALDNGVSGVQTPLQSLTHLWHIPVAFLVIPIFALFNAGIPLQLDSLYEALTHPVMLGVMLGLLLGKFFGITCACWLALRLGVAQHHTGTRFSQTAGVAVLGGIGFTMSIFIAELAFAEQPEFLLMAKTGVLAASLLAGVTGFVWLWLVAKRG